MSSFDIDITSDGGWVDGPHSRNHRTRAGPHHQRSRIDGPADGGSGHRGAHRRHRGAGRRPRSAHSGIPAGWASSSSTRRFISASVIGSPDLG
jgi:hypothetical protein